MLLRREECSQTLVSPEARPLNERFSSIKIGNLAILIGALLLLTTLVEFVRWRRERRQQHVQRGKEDPEKQVNHGRDYSDRKLMFTAIIKPRMVTDIVFRFLAI